MNSNGVPQFSFSGAQKTFLIGEKSAIEYLRKSLSSLSLYITDSNENIFEENIGNIIIFGCNFSDLRSVKVVKRAMLRMKNSKAIKIIHSVGETDLSSEKILFAHILGANYISFGVDGDQKLRSYIKSFLFTIQKKQVSFARFSANFKKYKESNDKQKIKALYQQLGELGKETYPELLKLKIKICVTLEESQKFSCLRSRF